MLPSLRISPDSRRIETAEGKPFFYLADTAWGLFHRLNREDASRYLEDRAAKGFNVIQAVLLAEPDGLNTPNALGDRPLIENDPCRPSEPYFQHVDWIAEKAASLGLHIGLLPTWGDKWSLKHGVGPVIFTPENAFQYGEWLGRRYRDRSVIWIMGGDRSPETPEHFEILSAMADGVKQGDGGKNLMTFHPAGAEGSSTWFHEDSRYDFNFRQNGHEVEYPRYALTRADYDRTPVKPVIDGEPVYEDIPISLKIAEPEYTTASDVRRALYWNIFGGACGHTYGHHSIWQFFKPGQDPILAPIMSWQEGLRQPGSSQMQHGRHLMESRPCTASVPDDDILVPEFAIPGAGRCRFVALRDADRTWAMVYAPVSRAFTVRLDAIDNEDVKAWWFDPRTGEATSIGEYPAHAPQTFAPPHLGEAIDWVLVLDSSAAGYPPPGAQI